MLEIILPIRVTAKAYGFNAVYAGKHWGKRNADAARIHEKVWAELVAQKIPRKPLKGPDMACSIPVKPGHVPLQIDGVGYTQCREISQSEHEELTEDD